MTALVDTAIPVDRPMTTGSLQADLAVSESGAVRRCAHEHELHYALLQPQEEDRCHHRTGERRSRRCGQGDYRVLHCFRG